MKRCAVIGGGLGGLTAAAYMASYGYEVDLFEQEEEIGGKAMQRKFGDFIFDGGPTLFTMPFVLDMFREETKSFSVEPLSIQPLEETCRYFYPDGTVFHAYADKERLFDEVERTMSDTRERVSEYLDYCKRLYDLSSDLFLFSSFHELEMLLEHRDKMSPLQVLKLDFIRTMHWSNRSFFSDRKMIQFADRYATYNGSNPYRVPATLNIIHHVEQLGASVPRDGIGAIPEYLKKNALEKGVTIHYGKPVRRIVVEFGRVRGIETDDGFIPYRVIFSNVDVAITYRNLLENNHNRDALKYRIMQPSSSALVFYWGMKICQDRLAVHNILFPENYRQEFRHLFGAGTVSDDPTVYIYISSGYNSSHAPEGHENWYVMINAPSIRDKQDWNAETARIRETVMKKIRKHFGIDVQQHLVSEEVMTPEEIESRTGSYRGSIYGISSNNMFSAFLRQGNRSRVFDGLYFSGGSAHPGGGIPLAILSGRTAAGLARKHER